MGQINHRKSNSQHLNSQKSNKQGGIGSNGINMKFVKPSELNLDFINPAHKPGHKLAGIGQHVIGPSTTTNLGPNSNVQNILNNMRTP